MTLQQRVLFTAEDVVTVPWETGLHLRKAAEVAKLARRFKAHVHVHSGLHTANVTSPLELLGLGAAYLTVLRFTARGPEAVSALIALGAMFGPRTTPHPLAPQPETAGSVPSTVPHNRLLHGSRETRHVKPSAVTSQCAVP